MPAVRKPRPQRRTFLRQWREYRQLTQEAAAERIGMDRTTLSRIERGRVPYDQALLEAAADAYACEPADLLVRDPSREDFIWSIMDTLKAVPVENQPQVRQIVETFKRKAS